jgi:hypothetical protein
MRTFFHGVAVAALLVLAGCAGRMHSSSPWIYGGGVHVAPGYEVGTAGMTVHPTVSYTWLTYEGGHDQLVEFGAQVRRPLGDQKGWWIGGEGVGAWLRESFGSFSSNDMGWAATGLFGKPVGESKWGVHVYGGAGVSHYGSFGKNIRFGVDLQPWFLKKTK